MNQFDKKDIFNALQALRAHSEEMLRKYPDMTEKRWYHRWFGMNTRGEIHQYIIRLCAAGAEGLEKDDMNPAKRALDFLIHLYQADYDANSESLIGWTTGQNSATRRCIADFRLMHEQLV